MGQKNHLIHSSLKPSHIKINRESQFKDSLEGSLLSIIKTYCYRGKQKHVKVRLFFLFIQIGSFYSSCLKMSDKGAGQNLGTVSWGKTLQISLQFLLRLND